MFGDKILILILILIVYSGQNQMNKGLWYRPVSLGMNRYFLTIHGRRRWDNVPLSQLDRLMVGGTGVQSPPLFSTITIGRIIPNWRELMRCFRHSSRQPYNRMITFGPLFINMNQKRINIYIHYTLWDDITYQFPNFDGCCWSLGMDKQSYPTLLGVWAFIHAEIKVNPSW